MSCDSTRRKYWREQVAGQIPAWGRPLGLQEPRPCVRFFEQIYATAAARATAPQGSHVGTPPAATNQAAQALLAELGTPRGAGGHGTAAALLARPAARAGYGTVGATLQAIRQQTNWPPVAAEVLVHHLATYNATQQPLGPAPTWPPRCPACGEWRAGAGSHFCRVAPGDSVAARRAALLQQVLTEYAIPALTDLLPETQQRLTAAIAAAIPAALPAPPPPVAATEAAPPSPPATIYYYAFGSNMDPARLRGRGIPFGRRLGAALPGWELAFDKQGGGQGYANVHPVAGGRVEGVLYEIPLAALATLHRYEGYPDHYGLQPALVEVADGPAVPAVMYVAPPEQQVPGLRPTATYLQHLVRGADVLSPAYAAALAAQPTTPPPAAPRPAGQLARPAAAPQKRPAPARLRPPAASAPFPAPLGLDAARAALAADRGPDRWAGLLGISAAFAVGDPQVTPAILAATLPLIRDPQPLVRGGALRWHDTLVAEPAWQAALRTTAESGSAQDRAAALIALRSAAGGPDSDQLAALARTAQASSVGMVQAAGVYLAACLAHPLATQHPRRLPPGWATWQQQLAAADRQLEYGEPLPVFVYGTLRHGQGNYAHLLAGATTDESVAWLENTAMYRPGIAYVTDSPGDRVIGELMTPTPGHYGAILARLDRLEGFDPARPARSWGYRRVARAVLIPTPAGDLTLQRAWVYQGAAPLGQGRADWTPRTFVPSGNWLAARPPSQWGWQPTSFWDPTADPGDPPPKL